VTIWSRVLRTLSVIYFWIKQFISCHAASALSTFSWNKWRLQHHWANLLKCRVSWLMGSCRGCIPVRIEAILQLFSLVIRLNLHNSVGIKTRLATIAAFHIILNSLCFVIWSFDAVQCISEVYISPINLHIFFFWYS